MQEHWEYDAFISYRHLPLDQAVADRVQKLLENYRAPRSLGKDHERRIRKIFRDRTELPTSGDLDDALQRALASSRFLIVVLTRELQESRWCMEEIRSFKEAHGGRIDHILPILADGEPDESIPDILRHETRQIVLADGTAQAVEAEVEPLCCDVRSDSTRGVMKKLRTEFLRLVAPILGVGYDDLYKRHLRRRTQRAAAVSASVFVLLTGVISTISYFAYQTYQAKQQYQSNLVDNYARQGASQISQEDYEQAMMYYAQALALDSGTQAAKTGALLLLQQHGWLNHVSDSEGKIVVKCIDRSGRLVRAMDAAGEKVLRYGEDGYYMADPDGNVLADLSDYGDFIRCAENGSCWTFAASDTVTFFFPEDASAAQVERPSAINPKCNPEDAKYYADSISEATAVSRTRAVINYGGYLYLYNLSETETAGELFQTFDLAQVFEQPADTLGELGLAMDPDTLQLVPADEGTETQNLMFLSFLWVDDGGELGVLYDGATAAVFNLAEPIAPSLIYLHEQYGRSLQDVAFSQDGEYYALAYGNNDGISHNPGGCLEVYEQDGTCLMATDFDGATPLEGAVFEPNGNRIAAWGSGELQVWNWRTGEPLTVPVQLSSISDALWLEDGSLAVDDGKGNIGYYTVARFKAETGEAVELTEYEEPDYRQTEAILNSGYCFKKEYTSVTVTDPEDTQTVLDELRVEDISNRIFLVNRMYVDSNHDTVYIWDSGEAPLLEIKVDESGHISVAQELDTRGKIPLKLNSVYNGVLVEMGTGDLYYYEDGQTEPAGILRPGTGGTIQSVVSNAQGLVSFVIRNQHYTNEYHFDNVYSVELWDLNKNVMLAEFAKNSSRNITSLTLSDDARLAYVQDDRTTAWILDAPAPDEEITETLQAMTCYRLDESQNTKVADTVFDPQALGSWSALLHLDNDASLGKDAVAEESMAEKMNRLLKEQGEDAWMDACEKWWSSEEPDEMDLDELCEIADDFFSNARELEREQEQPVRTVLERFVKLASEDAGQKLATRLRVSYVLTDILFYTPENIDLLVEYYERMAAQEEEDAKESGDLMTIMSAYGDQISAGILRGEGLDVFEINDSELYRDYSALFMLSGYNMYLDLFDGRPGEAAQEVDEAYYPEDASDYWDVLQELIGYVKVGILSEEDYSEFVQSLKFTTGMRLTKVSQPNMEAGLRLGDVVTSINGVYFGVPQYISLFDRDEPADLTVLRDGQPMTVHLEGGWTIAGKFAR